MKTLKEFLASLYTILIVSISVIAGMTKEK